MDINCNTGQCIKTGEILRKFQIRKDFIQRSFLSCNVSPTIKKGAFLVAVAICEQTRSLHNLITGSRGWEYIEEVFTELMLKEHPLTKPENFTLYTRSDLEKMLLEVFSPFGDIRYSTLDNIG